ncbi:MAG: hypothetical protein QOH53_2078 [Ilumatobacteraceae bacterium]
MRDVRRRPAHLSSRGLEAGRELGESFVDRQLARREHHVVGHPPGKRLFDNPVRTRGRVLLAKRGKLLGCKVIGRTRKRRPESAMNKSHLAPHQAKANNIG